MSTPETKPSIEALEQELAKLKAERAELMKARRAEFNVKIGEKGGVSVYGLGSRFPVTLYAEQWQVLFDNAGSVAKFIKDHTQQIEAAKILRKAKQLAEKKSS